MSVKIFPIDGDENEKLKTLAFYQSFPISLTREARAKRIALFI